MISVKSGVGSLFFTGGVADRFLWAAGNSSTAPLVLLVSCLEALSPRLSPRPPPSPPRLLSLSKSLSRPPPPVYLSPPSRSRSL